MQRLQNKPIKFIKSNEQEELTIKEIHEKYKIEAYNVRLHRRGSKLWDKFTTAEEELTNRSLVENNNNHLNDHYWWRRIANTIEREEPEPIYT